jgi:hypothetical protein
MTSMKRVTPRKCRPLGLEPWALRRRGGPDTARFMIATATDDASQRKGLSAEHCVEIEPTHYTSTVARYRVTYLGKPLIQSARDPEFDACRTLLTKGIRGMLVTCAPGSSVPRMRVDIEKGAKLSTIDNATDGPRIGRYRPHPNSTGGEDVE